MKQFYSGFLAVTLALVIVFLYGCHHGADSHTNENKQIIITAKSFAGALTNIKAGDWTDSAKGTAANVSIALELSEDKTSITNISFIIKEIKWEIKTAGSDTTGTSSGGKFYLNGPFPIKNNTFNTTLSSDASSINGSTIGRFVSPNEVQGSAHLYNQEMVGSQLYHIDLGEWQWTATAK